VCSGGQNSLYPWRFWNGDDLDEWGEFAVARPATGLSGALVAAFVLKQPIKQQVGPARAGYPLRSLRLCPVK
jgi:hypothetical protein